MRMIRGLHALVAVWLVAVPLVAAQQSQAPTDQAPRGLEIANKPWRGDFGALTERRMIRVAVPFGRTLYFSDKGEENGITAGLVRDFERWINQKHRKDKRPITVYVVRSPWWELGRRLLLAFAILAGTVMLVYFDRGGYIDGNDPTGQVDFTDSIYYTTVTLSTTSADVFGCGSDVSVTPGPSSTGGASDDGSNSGAR